MIDQLTKARTFQSLHAGAEPLLLPNPWDAGSAKLLASLGFEALATTSFGASISMGTTVATADAILQNCREICAATHLPVNVDLENCFADQPEAAARMISRACEVGAVGGSIEDATGDRAAPIYEFNLSVERVYAAVETARSLPIPFTLTARAEGLLHGQRDVGEIIKRLQAYEAAGADVLYAPGLKTIAEMRVVVESLTKPVNVVMGFADPAISLAQLAEIDVGRVSIGAGFSRVAMHAMMQAAQSMKEGRFEFVSDMISVGELRRAFGEED